VRRGSRAELTRTAPLSVPAGVLLNSPGGLVHHQHFRRIIGYRHLAKLVIAIERHAMFAAPREVTDASLASPVPSSPSPSLPVASQDAARDPRLYPTMWPDRVVG
jgi:hypothetical protein